MNIRSKSGYSLIEIGIALIIVAIFMVSSLTLLAASNDNYRRIEQKNIAMSYAIKAIEALQIEDNSIINLDEIKNKAKVENNMEVKTSIESLPPKDGKDYGNKVQIITVTVDYKIKSKDAGSVATMTLKTLKVNR